MKKFKSIEDNLKEKGFQIDGLYNNKTLLEHTSKLSINIAKEKYSKCAIIPLNILTEGHDPVKENSTAIYVLPTNIENENKIAMT